MQILSKQSGFKNARDLILFVIGIGLCIWHISTTPPSKLSWQLLLFGASLAGLPTAFRQDERKE